MWGRGFTHDPLTINKYSQPKFTLKLDMTNNVDFSIGAAQPPDGLTQIAEITKHSYNYILATFAFVFRALYNHLSLKANSF